MAALATDTPTNDVPVTTETTTEEGTKVEESAEVTTSAVETSNNKMTGETCKEEDHDSAGMLKEESAPSETVAESTAAETSSETTAVPVELHEAKMVPYESETSLECHGNSESKESTSTPCEVVTNVTTSSETVESGPSDSVEESSAEPKINGSISPDTDAAPSVSTSSCTLDSVTPADDEEHENKELSSPSSSSSVLDGQCSEKKSVRVVKGILSTAKRKRSLSPDSSPHLSSASEDGMLKNVIVIQSQNHHSFYNGNTNAHFIANLHVVLYGT